MINQIGELKLHLPKNASGEHNYFIATNNEMI